MDPPWLSDQLLCHRCLYHADRDWYPGITFLGIPLTTREKVPFFNRSESWSISEKPFDCFIVLFMKAGGALPYSHTRSCFSKFPFRRLSEHGFSSVKCTMKVLWIFLLLLFFGKHADVSLLNIVIIERFSSMFKSLADKLCLVFNGCIKLRKKRIGQNKKNPGKELKCTSSYIQSWLCSSQTLHGGIQIKTKLTADFFSLFLIFLLKTNGFSVLCAGPLLGMFTPREREEIFHDGSLRETSPAWTFTPKTATIETTSDVARPGASLQNVFSFIVIMEQHSNGDKCTNPKSRWSSAYVLQRQAPERWPLSSFSLQIQLSGFWKLQHILLFCYDTLQLSAV